MTCPNTVTIAVLTDLHAGPRSAGSKRRTEIADVLLRRAVARLNRLIRPDVTVVLGDVLDDGTAGDAHDRLSRVRAILDQLEAPYIAIPGNHDGPEDLFYKVFDRPRPFTDLAGVRFVSFVDPEEPGYNARRRPADLERLRHARQDHRGPVVALQHTCLSPPDRPVAPYNYTNAAEIIDAMEHAGVTLSVSGHYHPGCDTIRVGDMHLVHAPALCEAPFPFLVITLTVEQIRTMRQNLAMPADLDLVDGHVHTQLAYCNDTMNVASAIDLARDFGLAGMAFAEHSGQLYFDRDRYWNKTCLREGMPAAHANDNRMNLYLALKRMYESDTVRFGLEADCDDRGNLLLAPQDRTRFAYLVGACHGLPGLSRAQPPAATDHDDFLFLTNRLLAQGIDVLAHPFRVFRRHGWTPPPELFRPTAQLLQQHRVAAEINCHTNEPPVPFLTECLDLGVRFSLASDAHDLAEIGDFAYHLDLLQQAGFDGNLEDVLVTP